MRNDKITLSLRTKEKENLKKQAKILGLSLSEYLRRLIELGQDSVNLRNEYIEIKGFSQDGEIFMLEVKVNSPVYVENLYAPGIKKNYVGKLKKVFEEIEKDLKKIKEV